MRGPSRAEVDGGADQAVWGGRSGSKAATRRRMVDAAGDAKAPGRWCHHDQRWHEGGKIMEDHVVNIGEWSWRWAEGDTEKAWESTLKCSQCPRLSKCSDEWTVMRCYRVGRIGTFGDDKHVILLETTFGGSQFQYGSRVGLGGIPSEGQGSNWEASPLVGDQTVCRKWHFIGIYIEIIDYHRFTDCRAIVWQ